MTEQTVERYNMCQLELWAYRVVLEPQGSVLTISTSFLTDVELKMGFACLPWCGGALYSARRAGQVRCGHSSSDPGRNS
jgi:hypothetical protein